MQNHILTSIFDRLFLPEVTTKNGSHDAMKSVCENVRLDLEMLLNTRRKSISANLPRVRASIAGYGVEYLSPYSLASLSGQQLLARQLASCITRFEPRLRNVVVSALRGNSRQRLRFRIDAQLRTNALAERVVFDSTLESATGMLSIVKATP